jgi:hypothetical protein
MAKRMAARDDLPVRMPVGSKPELGAACVYVRNDIYFGYVSPAQAAPLARRGDQDAPALQRGPDRSWIPPTKAASWREPDHAPLSTDAGIGPRCHELRVQDENRTWRIIHRVDRDAVIIVEVFAKTSQTTPKSVVELSQDRLGRYDRASKGRT